MRCLLIDNYDSFTYNLADYIGESFGEPPLVVFNDQYSWKEITESLAFDCIVISPGPGSVTKSGDFNVAAQAVSQSKIPVFGVCLGFQGIAYHHGGRIIHCPVPYHGRTSLVYHQRDDMFANITSPFEVVRYHSLMVELPKNGELIPTATTQDGIIMGLRHKTLPKWGVQFHPESILTSFGHQIIHNYRDLAHRYLNKVQVAVPELRKLEVVQPKKEVQRHQLVYQKLPLDCTEEDIFTSLFAEQRHSFWLDSQTALVDEPRFSFMGSVEDQHILRYSIQEDCNEHKHGHAMLNDMETRLGEIEITGTEDLPFNFYGGLVGYLSYEMKALFGAKRKFDNAIPDMVWMHIDGFLAFDHQTNEIYLVTHAPEGATHKAQLWLEQMQRQLAQVKPSSPLASNYLKADSRLELTMDANYAEYINAIKRCQAAIVEGDTYEVCLTNHFSLDVDIDPYSLYRCIRRGNPAPFGAFIKTDGVSILSTSPERFLRVDPQKTIQAKPIKGTCRRSNNLAKDQQLAQELKESQKDRAENLMIVDLMRNDLNRVSKPGSVIVPKLMEIESYKTVHQMVSTVESKLADDHSLLDLIRVTFPGGSISGAPKLRTMEIIDDLERSARGVYCGAIGYLGYNRVADLNIGIRTMSYDYKKLRFGAGGAITYLSLPEAEFDEIILKAEALSNPLWEFFGGHREFMLADLDGNKLVIREPNMLSCEESA
jgi:para-aminobenzoate synthetase